MKWFMHVFNKKDYVLKENQIIDGGENSKHKYTCV